MNEDGTRSGPPATSTDRRRFASRPAIIGRDVLGGRLVRRWDRDDTPVQLNASAAAVLDAVTPGATSEEAVAYRAAGTGRPITDELRAAVAQTIRELVARHLVIDVDDGARTGIGVHGS